MVGHAGQSGTSQLHGQGFYTAGTPEVLITNKPRMRNQLRTYCQVKLQISRPKNVSSSRNRKSSPQYVMDTVLLLFTSYNLLAKVCEVIEYQRSVTYGRIIVFWILLLCEAVECLLVLRWCSWWWCLLRCRPLLCLGCCCACCCRRCDLLF